VSLSDSDRKILWTKAGNRCSFHYGQEHCDEELVRVDNEKQVLLGEECHIVGEKPGSARHIVNYAAIDSYSNRILMCPKHHKVIDSDELKFTATILSKMKESHEKSIAERMAAQEIHPVIIKDSVFRTIVEHADEAIGMEVNAPTQFQNVTSEVIAHDVKSVTGFKTNQTLNAILMTCSSCRKYFSIATVGTLPRSVNCPHCGCSNIVNNH
jgi:hypothetical protein